MKIPTAGAVGEAVATIWGSLVSARRRIGAARLRVI